MATWQFKPEYDNGGHPTWKLYAGNGELVAWAGESFASMYNAKQAAQAFKTGAKTATYDVFLDAGGYWRWRAIRGGNKVASSGESFYNQTNAQRAAQNVRDNAGYATGP